MIDYLWLFVFPGVDYPKLIAQGPPKANRFGAKDCQKHLQNIIWTQHIWKVAPAPAALNAFVSENNWNILKQQAQVPQEGCISVPWFLDPMRARIAGYLVPMKVIAGA